MNVFFGKISPNKAPIQFIEGYYQSDVMSWYNGINVGDYCFAISGGKIKLWQARIWGERNGEQALEFNTCLEIEELNLNTNKLVAIKYFTLTVDLLVNSRRSTAKSEKGFFKIHCTDELTKEILLDKNTYNNNASFRKIHIHTNPEHIIEQSTNVQLLKQNGKWNLYKSSFIDDEIIQKFRDNTPMLGYGRRNKDNTIRKITHYQGQTLSVDQISLLDIYDLFCSEY